VHRPSVLVAREEESTIKREQRGASASAVDSCADSRYCSWEKTGRVVTDVLLWASVCRDKRTRLSGARFSVTVPIIITSPSKIPVDDFSHDRAAADWPRRSWIILERVRKIFVGLYTWNACLMRGASESSSAPAKRHFVSLRVRSAA